MIKQIFSCIGIFVFCQTMVQCQNEDSTIGCFPNSTINVDIDLSYSQYQKLDVTGGWVYIKEQASGTRGLIVVRTSSTGGFKAYDRNAPHICPGNHTTLEVKDDFKIFCPEDGAEWILSSGEPIKIAHVPPKTYNVYYSGNILLIRN